jgi:hypothetical protein
VYTWGVKLPHLGKPVGTAGKSLFSPTWITTAMPVAIWYRKWQWKIQYPTTETITIGAWRQRIWAEDWMTGYRMFEVITGILRTLKFDWDFRAVLVKLNLRSTRRVLSSKAACSVNPRWTNTVLYRINEDTGMRSRNVKVKLKLSHYTPRGRLEGEEV